ncbi:MAG: hypothetical protein ACREDR_05005 [Blastocatellia bacterium]
MLSPRQAFEDNMRPAELLLRVYRLLENDALQTSGAMLADLRKVVGCDDNEELLLLYNEVFLGLIRERAQIPAAALKRSALDNLLRQAVVVACTALDTYLPSLLRTNLPVVIEVKGRDFVPQDGDLNDYFKELTFDLTDTMRMLSDTDAAPLFIANKILALTNFKYLSSRKGVHAVAALLAIEKPWPQIAEKLQRDRKDLMGTIDETSRRRNDIVHRADRLQSDPSGTAQDISYASAKQSVDTISHVCLALDELVASRMAELKANYKTRTQTT